MLRQPKRLLVALVGAVFQLVREILMQGPQRTVAAAGDHPDGVFLPESQALGELQRPHGHFLGMDLYRIDMERQLLIDDLFVLVLNPCQTPGDILILAGGQHGRDLRFDGRLQRHFLLLAQLQRRGVRHLGQYLLQRRRQADDRAAGILGQLRRLVDKANVSGVGIEHGRVLDLQRPLNRLDRRRDHLRHQLARIGRWVQENRVKVQLNIPIAGVVLVDPVLDGVDGAVGRHVVDSPTVDIVVAGSGEKPRQFLGLLPRPQQFVRDGYFRFRAISVRVLQRGSNGFVIEPTCQQPGKQHVGGVLGLRQVVYLVDRHGGKNAGEATGSQRGVDRVGIADGLQPGIAQRRKEALLIVETVPMLLQEGRELLGRIVG